LAKRGRPGFKHDYSHGKDLTSGREKQIGVDRLTEDRLEKTVSQSGKTFEMPKNKKKKQSMTTSTREGVDRHKVKDGD